MSKSIDIRPDHFQIVTDIFNKHLDGSDIKVFVYGSRARWTAKDSSDLDLALECDDEISPRLIRNLRTDFENSDLPYKADVVDLSQIDGKIRKVIKKEMVLIKLFIWDERAGGVHRGIKKEHLVLKSKEDAPKNWVVTSLSEVADIIDSLHKTPRYSSKGKPMVRATDVKYGTLDLFNASQVSDDVFNEFSRQYKPQENDIIITRVGTYGMTAKVKDTDFCMGQNVSAIIPKKICSNYLYAFLNSSYAKSQIESKVVGSTQKTLSLKSIRSLKIPRFGESIEVKIGYIISTIDSKIYVNNNINEILEKIAQAIFKSWFIDFDPVHAKKLALEKGLSKEQAERAGMAIISGICTPKDFAENFKEMDRRLTQKLTKMSKEQQKELKHTASLFPSEFEESELGKIPKGWLSKRMKYALNPVRGFSYKGAGLSTSGIPMHNLNSVYEGGGYKSKGIKYYNLEYKLKFEIEPEDVIIANTEQGHKHLLIGYGARIPSFYPKGIFSHHLYRVHPKHNSITKQFIQHIFKNPFYVKTVQGYSNGTTVNMLPLDSLQGPFIIIPDRLLVNKFSLLTRQVNLESDLIYKENKTLEKVRDALLPKLLAGKIDLSNIKLEDDRVDKSKMRNQYE
ncbi:MAG: restriction endonuclease subunit S [Bacteriovoracales bacterium]|nr:restriction endonuclease subunit S [Bacteriovoracales bacterium]